MAYKNPHMIFSKIRSSSSLTSISWKYSCVDCDLEEKKSWLTSGILKMSVNEIDWLESDIFNVDYEKIKNIKVEHSDKSILLLSKDDKNENLIILRFNEPIS